MDDMAVILAIHHLSKYSNLHYGKRVIILLDEYDTPMQEAYVHGYWKELVAFIRSMFNSALKTNPYLERAIMIGITRVSKESIFSDLNNLEVVTTTFSKYGTVFGFTEEEVFAAVDEFGLEEKEKAKSWYDGFIFGQWKDIETPWSILDFHNVLCLSTVKGMDISMEIFNDYAYYYNAFYQDKDYKAEAAQIDCLLRRYGKDISTIINFGCGTGKHDIELAKMGYLCAGIDQSPLMIETARENSKQADLCIDFSVADIRNFESQKRYDAVISLFHVMSYQTKNQDICQAFQSARKALGEKGGVFLFDVWYGPGVLSDKPCVRVKEIEDEKNRLVRIARPVMHDKENVVDVCYEVFVIDKESGQTKVINEVHNMRYFFKPELEYILQDVGFELIDNLDCQTFGETDYSSWTSYFVARAV